MDQAPGAGPGLVAFKSLTVYLPDESGKLKGKSYPAERIIAAGMQGDTAIARVLEADGDVVDYYGLAMAVRKCQPSGLVAPRSGGVIVPPT